MYNSPFGSIFGQESTHLAKAMAKKKAPAKAMAKKKAPAKPKKQSAKIMREMRERMESVEKEEVYKPHAKAISGKKRNLVDNTLPQFRADVAVESKNPEVRKEQATFSLDKIKIKYGAVKRKFKELKRKHATARLYNDMLVQYSQLPAKHKQEIDKWIKKNIDAVKKLSSARKLKKITNDTKEAIKALDLEIKHLEKLHKLKKKGINVAGGQTLKSFRTKGTTKIKESDLTPDRGPLPLIGGKISTKDIVRLGSRGVSEIQGYGDDPDHEGRPPKNIPKKEKDVVLTKKMAKEIHKKGKFKEVFAKGLKGKRYYLDKRQSRRKDDKLVRGTENALLSRMQVKWDLEKLEKKVDKEVAKYNKTQKSIKGLIDKTKKDGVDGERASTVIGILSEARPEKFIASATLLDALKNSFKLLSQLGYFGQEVITPDQEANILLATSAKESEDAIRELESRQNAAAQLRAEIEDKPVPSPIRTPTPIIIIQVKQVLERQEQEEQKKEEQMEQIKKAGAILPMIIGGFILFKLL